LISDTADGPALFDSLAMTVTSVTLGDSLTITGTEVVSLTVRVTAAAIAGSAPKATPPFSHSDRRY